ncbi:hypothetical protein CBR_g30386 [Chara braunii]|uniref:Uncharacterized protein n=1 Tax=Chara braunii TaxID=69332 RepID=A0A388JXG6_CHABU|nr:hypothetical protein CBR_g30386 [Chara braunii]|eukprot:GBG62432.1 hypothetical protein CBR_g30386 [Chara braunii]
MNRELEPWDCTWEPRRIRRGVEMSVPPSYEWKGTTCDWRGYEIVSELSYLWIERVWNPLREEEGWEEIAEGRVESIGTIVLSEQGWHLFCTTLAAGQDPMWLLGDAEARARQAGERFANKGWDTVSSRVVMGGRKEFKPPGTRTKIWVPEFVADWFGGFEHVTEVADTMERTHVDCAWLAEEFYRTSLKFRPFHGDRARDVLIILEIERNDRQEVAPETREAIIRREVAATPCYVDNVFKLFEEPWGQANMGKIAKIREWDVWSLVGKGMALEEEAEELRSEGSQGTGRGTERNEASVKDRESAKPEGTREDGKDLSTGESSGKAGGSKRGPQENRAGRDNERASLRNSGGTTPKKMKVSDARREEQLTRDDIEKIDRYRFVSMGYFLAEYEHASRKVWTLSEHNKCFVFLMNFTNAEQRDLIRGAEGRLVWNKIRQNLEQKDFDQYLCHTLREARKRKKALDSEKSELEKGLSDSAVGTSDAKKVGSQKDAENVRRNHRWSREKKNESGGERKEIPAKVRVVATHTCERTLDAPDEKGIEEQRVLGGVAITLPHTASNLDKECDDKGTSSVSNPGYERKAAGEIATRKTAARLCGESAHQLRELCRNSGGVLEAGNCKANEASEIASSSRRIEEGVGPLMDDTAETNAQPISQSVQHMKMPTSTKNQPKPRRGYHTLNLPRLYARHTARRKERMKKLGQHKLHQWVKIVDRLCCLLLLISYIIATIRIFRGNMFKK